MKKNEKKITKPPEVRAREQLEDIAFNKMLLWICAAALVEVVMLLINRYYVHMRAGAYEHFTAIHNLLIALFVVGVILFALFLAWGLKIRKKGEWKDGTGQIIAAFASLAIGVGAILLRTFSNSIAPLVLGGVPGLAVIILVFYLYQKEFFACTIVGGLGMVGLWLFRSANARGLFYLYLVVAVVIMAAGVVLARKLSETGGTITVSGKELTLLQSNASYLSFYLTIAVTVVLLVAPLALGAAVAYYAIWVLAAWLFILAVYFTSRLM